MLIDLPTYRKNPISPYQLPQTPTTPIYTIAASNYKCWRIAEQMGGSLHFLMPPVAYASFVCMLKLLTCSSHFGLNL